MLCRTRIALLFMLEGVVARRPPLPLATWYSLEQREWRIASTKHANSYQLPLPRRQRREWGSRHLRPRGSRGLLRRLGDACVVDGWYQTALVDRPVRVHARGWPTAPRREPLLVGAPDVLILGKVSGFDPWQSNIAPSLVAALPPSSWCFARWSLQLQRLVPRGAVGDAQ